MNWRLASAPGGPGGALQPSPAAGDAGATFLSAPAPSPEEPLGQELHARLSLDAPSDTITVDIRGSLTTASQEALAGIIGRIRQLRAGTRIRVLLENAWFVDPVVLAKLRTTSYSTGTYIRRSAGSAVRAGAHTGASSRVALAATAGGGLRTPGLARYTVHDLLAASDFLFAWLDDENGCPGTDVFEMIAQYELIGQELSARNTIPMTTDERGRNGCGRAEAAPTHSEEPSARPVPDSRVRANAGAREV